MMQRKSTHGTAGSRRIVASAMLVVLVALTTNLVVGTVAAEPPTRQDYFGVVVSVSQDLLVISTDGTTVDIPVSDNTKVRLPQKRDAQITDLAEGDRVAVTLEEEGGVLTADTIFLIPGKTRTRHVPGEVISLAAGSITIQPVADGATPITFNISTTTPTQLHKKVTGLEVGSFVIVVAGRDSLTGELLPDALEINVVPRRSARPEETGAGEPTAALTNRVEIEGVLEGISTTTGRWIVDSTEVEIDASTKIDDGVAVGDLVEVDGVLQQDGTILALEIEARDYSRQVAAVTRIDGIFQGVDDEGRWLVGGAKITVGPGTDTDGLPSIGQRVKVKALVQPDGPLLAREIENVRGSSVDKGDSRQVKIKGILQEIDPDGRWIVNGAKVSLGPDTRLNGTPAVGQLVEVRGRVQEDGSLLATKIEGKGKDVSNRKRKVELEGVIQGILDDDTLVINGIQVHVGALTELEGDPVPGDYVEVEAFLTEDGTLIAREVESKGSLEADEVPDPSEVEIEGTIDRINDDGTLVVSGITVATTTITEIRGELTVGASVKIEGVLQMDGTLLAREIKGEGRRATSSRSEVHVEGLVETVNLDGNGRVVSVVVYGLTVAVDALTRIEGRLAEGSSVKIKGIVSGGVILAGKIEARQDRQDEAEQDRRPRSLRIEGLIDSIATSTAGIIGIRVNGVDVVIERNTELDADLRVGDNVKVTAVSVDGAVVATKVDAKESKQAKSARSDFKLVGVVESVDRDDSGNIVGVVVDSRSIEVQGLTRVKGLVEPGLEVQVQGVVIGDTLVARKIEGRDGNGRQSVQGGRGKLEFKGIVASFISDATSTLLVLEDGRSFLVREGTEIEGDLAVGSQVRVKAEFTDGVSVATEVKVERPRGRGKDRDDDEDDRDGQPEAKIEEGSADLEIDGVVASISAGATSTTVVLQDGTSFVVRRGAEIEGEFAVGARVRVRAVETDGVTVAAKVKVEDSRDGAGGDNGDRDENGNNAEPEPEDEDEDRVELEFSGVVVINTTGVDSTTVMLEDGTSFVVRPGTEIEGELAVGARVHVRTVETDGVTVAANVKVE